VSSRAIADTSLVIARETGRPLDSYEEDLEIAVSIVTIAELELGVLTAATAPRIRAARLQTLRDAEQLTAVPLDRAVASAFAKLVVEMRAAAHGRLGVQDAWIAATAIAHDADLLTQDADFDAVPSLRVIKL
jgi:predicted nucleic acid-binding protein